MLSRTELAAQVWGMNFDSETNVVEVAVRRLRDRIKPARPMSMPPTIGTQTILTGSI